ncbi:MAG: hypothetical protein AAB548_00385 [Patescibacteria group bacterium]
MSEITGTSDSSFSSFMFGLTLGVIGALLLGTEEGRKTARKLLNSDLFQEVKTIAGQAVSQIGSQVKPPTASLPDQPTGFNEFPPPPPPLTNRPARTPSYFTSGGESLMP